MGASQIPGFGPQAFRGFQGGGYTHRQHPNHKNATVWGGWACEVPLRPHEVAQTCTHGASEPSAGGAGGHVLHRAYDI